MDGGDSNKLKRSLFTKTLVNEDKVVVNYKGKRYEIPHSEYHKKLSHPEQQTLPNHAQDVALPSDSVDTITSSKEELAKRTRQRNDPTASNHSQQFTLEDFVESEETFIYQRPPAGPSKSLGSKELLFQKSTSTVKRSDESLASVTGTLFYLKAQVNTMIDETIKNIESNETIGNNAVAGGTGDSRMHRAREDRCPQNYSKVLQNLKVYETPSFVKNRREIRMKLYHEIEKLVHRLKDMELLE